MGRSIGCLRSSLKKFIKKSISVWQTRGSKCLALGHVVLIHPDFPSVQLRYTIITKVRSQCVNIVFVPKLSLSELRASVTGIFPLKDSLSVRYCELLMTGFAYAWNLLTWYSHKELYSDAEALIECNLYLTKALWPWCKVMTGSQGMSNW